MRLLKGLKYRLKVWIAVKTESCKSVVHLFSHSLDRKLTILERIRVRIHLLTCTACLSYLSNLTFIHDAIRVTQTEIDQKAGHLRLGEDAAARIRTRLNSVNKVE